MKTTNIVQYVYALSHTENRRRRKEGRGEWRDRLTETERQTETEEGRENTMPITFTGSFSLCRQCVQSFFPFDITLYTGPLPKSYCPNTVTSPSQPQQPGKHSHLSFCLLTVVIHRRKNSMCSTDITPRHNTHRYPETKAKDTVMLPATKSFQLCFSVLFHCHFSFQPFCCPHNTVTCVVVCWQSNIPATGRLYLWDHLRGQFCVLPLWGTSC